MKIMKIIKVLSILVVIVIIGGFAVLRFVTTYVPVGQVGVRTQEYALVGSKGVVQNDFGPGWHRDLGPIDSWVYFDSTVQTLEMTRETEHGSVKGRDDVQVQSADGYAVSVDVTVKYRLKQGSAHKVFQNTGSGTKYRAIVRNEAQSACMGLFGQMRTEDLYDPDQRREKARAVHDKLSGELQDNFIEVIDVLIRDVQFDPEYESKIRTKKLADQEVELNKSMARAAEMKGKTQVIEAETDKLVQIITKEKEAELVRMQAEAELEIATIAANAEQYAVKRRADADLIVAQREAEGNLLVRKAEAEGERLRNQAMRGPGGDVLVALEAARALRLANMTVSTMDTDPLDLDAIASKLGVPE